MRHPEYQHQACLDVGVQEQLRRERHHDVLCLVLKELVDAATARRLSGAESLSKSTGSVSDTIGALVELAKRFADEAYPPPKAES